MVWLLVAIVLVLSLPVLVELARSLSAVFDAQDRAVIVDMYGSLSGVMLLVRSVLIAGGIALVGTALGIPLGRVLNACFSSGQGGKNRFWAGMLLIPIWLPAMLVYAAGNLLRAPDTVIGHALVSFSTSESGLRWVTIWAGYAIATLGLALWSAPIAGVLIAAGLGVRTSLYDEMIALEPVGIFRRGYLWIRLHSRALLRAWVLITTLMLGSAVPMHLAQLDTWSIVLWRELAQSPIDKWGRVWLGAWPSVLFGVLGAWVLTRTLVRPHTSESFADRGHALAKISKPILGGSVLVWALGALGPLIAMLVTLDDLDSVRHFWTLEGSAVIDSGLLALACGGMTMLIALLVAFALGSPSGMHRRLGMWSVMGLCVLGLIPGVLVGSAIARSSIPVLTTGWGGAMLASCVRAGFLGAIIGALCASAESAERRSVRWQLAGGSLSGWARAVLPSIVGSIFAAGLVGGLYSMYEIEASVMVRPPGMDNLPQQLLSDLHYARIEQLSGAGVNLLGIGLLFGAIASWALIRVHGRDRG
tara:strand:- start:42991 stop:44583 length:1593 start_codon:yes stop_codon:yes gene_type:complete